MSDDIGVKISCDTKDLVDGVGAATNSLESLAAVDLTNLIESVKSVGLIFGAMAIAIAAAKEAFDLTVQAEQIQNIQKQFETLGHSAGISTDQMFEGLKKASGGLIGNTELMKAANEAIVKMGASAAKLPEIMDLARKMTAGFGGDIMTNFNLLNTSIERGNTMLLKRHGINIDQNAALKTYADQLGTIPSLLDNQQKQQAVLNALLTQGADELKNIDVNANQTAQSFTRFKVSMGEFGDAIATNIGKVVGPTFSNFFKLLNDGMSVVTEKLVVFNSSWGQNAEVTNAQLSELAIKLHGLREELSQNDKTGGSWWARTFGDPQKEQNKIIAAIHETEAEINGLQQRKKQLATEDAKKSDGGVPSGDGAVDQATMQKRLEQEAKFQSDLMKLKKQGLDEEMKDADTVEKVNEIHERQRLMLVQETNAEVEKIRNSSDLTQAQKAKEIEQINQNMYRKLASFDDDLKKQRLNSIDVWEKKQVAAGHEFNAGFTTMGKKAHAEFNDMQKTGQIVFNSMNKNAANAFRAIGDGSQDAAGAMRGFMFSAIGDIADAKGQTLLAWGIGEMNPLAIAEGGALIAIGSLLKSQGGGSSTSTVGGASGGGGSATTASSTDTGTSPGTVTPQEKKSVTVQVMGNYFETEQTKTKLMEMIREATDATDFSYKQIGQA